ncbi:MAG: hypothetical protein HRU12_02800 [Phaeodactylibacter sp.]|nr:hypothetical protein [Phaeodactylibacter sp.]
MHQELFDIFSPVVINQGAVLTTGYIDYDTTGDYCILQVDNENYTNAKDGQVANEVTGSIMIVCADLGKAESIKEALKTDVTNCQLHYTGTAMYQGQDSKYTIIDLEFTYHE